MSHVVTIQTQVRDPVAIAAACRRLALPPPTEGETKLFSQVAQGWAVQLPGWRYPVVCEAAAGRIAYDNFEGRWGNSAELDRFIQSYAVERAKLEARRRGHSVTEQTLADGSIKLTIAVAGGVA